MREWLWASDRLLWAIFVPTGAAVLGIAGVMIRAWLVLRRPIRRSIPGVVLVTAVSVAYVGWLFKSPAVEVVRDIVLVSALVAGWLLLLDRIPTSSPLQRPEARESAQPPGVSGEMAGLHLSEGEAPDE